MWQERFSALPQSPINFGTLAFGKAEGEMMKGNMASPEEPCLMVDHLAVSFFYMQEF